MLCITKLLSFRLLFVKCCAFSPKYNKIHNVIGIILCAYCLLYSLLNANFIFTFHKCIFNPLHFDFSRRNSYDYKLPKINLNFKCHTNSYDLWVVKKRYVLLLIFNLCIHWFPIEFTSRNAYKLFIQQNMYVHLYILDNNKRYKQPTNPETVFFFFFISFF